MKTTKTKRTPGIWLGLRSDPGRAPVREVFRCDSVPTQETHGEKYNAVIGPFRTLRGARFMRGPGYPHCCNVRDAERLAKEYPELCGPTA